MIPTDHFHITESAGGPRHRLATLTGTLDASSAARLETHARQALESGLHLVLNLAQVSFISSTGIGVLLALREDFCERGLDLRLSTPSREVIAPMELICVDRFFGIFGSDDEASSEWAA